MHTTVWCIAWKRGVGRGGILPNSRAMVLYQGGQCRWSRGMKGWLIRAEKPRSKRISCKGQATTCLATLSLGITSVAPLSLPIPLASFSEIVDTDGLILDLPDTFLCSQCLPSFYRRLFTRLPAWPPPLLAQRPLRPSLYPFRAYLTPVLCFQFLPFFYRRLFTRLPAWPPSLLV